MPAQAPCPKCRGAFVEIDRSGIKIDVCQECRGVFLDRGELDQIIAADQRAVSNVYDEDESFFRHLAGQHGRAARAAGSSRRRRAQPAQPAYTPPPAQQPAQPTYTPPPVQPAHTPPPQQQPVHSAPPPQPVYGQSHGHGQPSHGTHQQYGFDRHTAERLLGDFRSHQSSHKKKHQKSLLQQLFD